MLSLFPKKNLSLQKKTNYCTGCTACASTCPVECISMEADNEGFLRPKIDKSRCINCSACEIVCPVLKNSYNNLIKPNKIVLTRSLNEEVLKRSSSGGLFHHLSEKTIMDGGVVYGAVFDDDWNVIHSSTTSIEKAALFKGSKYVQSQIGNSFKEIKSLLEGRRLVLFSGTPCQIAGLTNYLTKDYPNLLCVDFICHGVPSPIAFNRFLDFALSKEFPSASRNDIDQICFRDKKHGWKDYCTTISIKGNRFEMPTEQNPYMKGFLSNLFLRKSCSHCKFKNFQSGSDLTLADGWGAWEITDKWNDDKGCSLVIVHSKKGEAAMKEIQSSLDSSIPVDEEFIKKHNPSAFHSVKPHKNRKKFFKMLNEGKADFGKIIEVCLPPSTYIDRILWSINKRLNKIWPRKY